MRRSDRNRPGTGWGRSNLPPAPLPEQVHRDFIDTLFGMTLPISGLGVVFVGIAGLASLACQDPLMAGLAVAGAVVTVLRAATIRAYRKIGAPLPSSAMPRWERRYAWGSYTFALLLAALNVIALTYPLPLLHLTTVSLVFGYGAGIVARIAVRPVICATSVLIAAGPTVPALIHAGTQQGAPLNMELYGVQAFLLAMITALSLQTVLHLYRSAVRHHTAEHDLAHLAKRDALTGLANRLSLRERFQHVLAGAGREPNVAIHCLDLDGFKPINDHHGHPAGDVLLQLVARRLEAAVRAEDIVARTGGDEFVIVQTGVLHASEAELLARRAIRNLSAPYDIAGENLRISASIGIAMLSRGNLDLDQNLSYADAALYRAKRAGKGRACFYASGDSEAERLVAA